MGYFWGAVLGAVAAAALGVDMPPAPHGVSVPEWRVLLDEALENNRPDNPQFAEHLADWSNRLYLQAEASKPDSAYRDLDWRALIEYCVLLAYLEEFDRSSGRPTVFNKEDHALMASASAQGISTFGQPVMLESWEHFAALWWQFGLRPVPSPFLDKTGAPGSR